jgi:hypothetical protein
MFGLNFVFGGKKIRVKDKVRGMEQEWKQQSVATLESYTVFVHIFWNHSFSRCSSFLEDFCCAFLKTDGRVLFYLL